MTLRAAVVDTRVKQEVHAVGMRTTPGLPRASFHDAMWRCPRMGARRTLSASIKAAKTSESRDCSKLKRLKQQSLDSVPSHSNNAARLDATLPEAHLASDNQIYVHAALVCSHAPVCTHSFVTRP